MSTSRRQIRTARCQKASSKWEWSAPLVLDEDDELPESPDDMVTPPPDNRIPIGPLDVANHSQP